MSSSQLTNSIIFQRGWNHQPDRYKFMESLGRSSGRSNIAILSLSPRFVRWENHRINMFDFPASHVWLEVKQSKQDIQSSSSFQTKWQSSEIIIQTIDLNFWLPSPAPDVCSLSHSLRSLAQLVACVHALQFFSHHPGYKTVWWNLYGDVQIHVQGGVFQWCLLVSKPQ